MIQKWQYWHRFGLGVHSHSLSEGGYDEMSDVSLLGDQELESEIFKKMRLRSAERRRLSRAKDAFHAEGEASLRGASIELNLQPFFDELKLGKHCHR